MVLTCGTEIWDSSNLLDNTLHPALYSEQCSETERKFMSDSTPRERRQERTRHDILNAALGLIVEKGVEKLSLREIARRIDYSPAGLYEYFDGKDAIVDAVVQDGAERFQRRLELVPTTLPPDVYLLELGLAYIDFARLYPEHFVLLFSRMLAGRRRFDDPVNPADSYALLTRGVERALAAGVIAAQPDFDLEEIAYSAWALVHGMASLQAYHLREFEADFDATHRHAIRIWIDGLRP